MTDEDLKPVLALHELAFPDEDVAGLVSAIYADPAFIPDLSLVVVEDGAIIGHIMFTEADVAGTPSVLLAPLGVVPEWQSHGIGSALVEDGLNRASAMGYDLALVLGHPGYYPRFGFEPAIPLDIEPPYPVEPSDAWMVVELNRGAAEWAAGTVEVAASFMSEELWRE